MWELQDLMQVRRWYALHLVLCVTFFLASLIINACQFLLFFTIKPFNKTLFRHINYYLMYSIMAQILFLAEWWSGSEVRIYTDPEDMKKWGTEHTLIIMNHTYEVDWLMGWMVANKAGVLGAAKVFVKKMMQYVPTIGWAWRCSDIIFLSRNWEHDKAVMQNQIKEFYDYPYPIWFLLFFTIKPFNKTLFRQINYYLMYSIMAQILFLAEWWSGSEVRIYTDPEDMKKWGTEHTLIIMNHTYEVDWLMGWMVANKAGVLGAAKVFVKKMMQYVPTIGWAWRCSDIIFLSRNWEHDKAVMQNQIKEFYDYPYPVWMLLFAEGTRFTPQKHAASMEFARERGLTELKRHLIPRTRGFIQCAQSLKGHFPVIYDVTVAFNTKEGADPTMLNILQGRRVVGEMYIRRLPLDDVPVDDDKTTSKYLHQLYETKDLLLDSYCNTGSFTKQSGLPSYPAVTLQRRYCSLLNVAFWVSLCVWGGVSILRSASLPLQCLVALVFLLGTVSSCSVQSRLARYSLVLLGTVSSCSVQSRLARYSLVLLAYVGLYKLIGLTKITKGSEYGSSSPSSHSPPASSPLAAPSPPRPTAEGESKKKE
ncbi:Phospholipid/glycerol acyltransferase [Trinorchestia longiramus]|nr:Phospholipid/glycerol acyltransferase [Trinorchestia longiramus]